MALKNNLLMLVQQAEHIKDNFHISGGGGVPQFNVIYDTPDFCNWSQELQLELQNIFDRTNDNFIWSLLILLKQGFNGWNDVQSFNKLCGGLSAVQKNIEQYFSVDSQTAQVVDGGNKMLQKSSKVFISHSSDDKEYVSALVDFLEDIGLSKDKIFCSSAPGYGIPLDEDIYEYLKRQFQEYDLHVIFILSNNYYQSVASMNEMGAAWVLQNKYTTILLPGFEFQQISGAINPRQISLKLDGDLVDVKEKLGQLKNVLIEEFSLTSITDVRWEHKRDTFVNSIRKLSTSSKTILSCEALDLLRAASEDKNGTIIKFTTLSGTNIQANGKNFIGSQERREVAKWESILDELLANNFIKGVGYKGEIFEVTQIGYTYIENL